MSIVDTDSAQWQMGRNVAQKFMDAGPTYASWLLQQAETVITFPGGELHDFCHGVITALRERAQEVSS